MFTINISTSYIKNTMDHGMKLRTNMMSCLSKGRLTLLCPILLQDVLGITVHNAKIVSAKSFSKTHSNECEKVKGKWLFQPFITMPLFDEGWLDRLYHVWSRLYWFVLVLLDSNWFDWVKLVSWFWPSLVGINWTNLFLGMG